MFKTFYSLAERNILRKFDRFDLLTLNSEVLMNIDFIIICATRKYGTFI